jgi:hypothetical protein
MVGAARETYFAGKHIGRARGENAEWNAGSGNSVGGFIDGAIPAGGEDQITAGLDGFARELAGELGSGSGHEIDTRASVLQHTNGVVKTSSSVTFQSTGERVVYKSDTMG